MMAFGINALGQLGGLTSNNPYEEYVNVYTGNSSHTKGYYTQDELRQITDALEHERRKRDQNQRIAEAFGLPQQQTGSSKPAAPAPLNRKLLLL